SSDNALIDQRPSIGSVTMQTSYNCELPRYAS
ncbi:MAG: hypothetical protein QOE68_4249, partial [Thermoanaerobaculia bacterium]|nr:hypothetical protein [Thermoanaerobaculia bacterium]